MTNHQRKRSKSNAHVGREFEEAAQKFFVSSWGIQLEQEYPLDIGIDKIKKSHNFDLGIDNASEKVLVECKSHTWTESDKVPSAKMTTWNQAMYYFVIAPSNYRKIMFVLKDYSEKRKETLAKYYLRTYLHLIPKGVEIWEYSEADKTAEQIY
ncbi:MAG: hypothetical protein ACNYNY_01030 [Candidatus Oxydemutatoraceae bacterium WSBS_2016_MAG_OTU14]